LQPVWHLFKLNAEHLLFSSHADLENDDEAVNDACAVLMPEMDEVSTIKPTAAVYQFAVQCGLSTSFCSNYRRSFTALHDVRVVLLARSSTCRSAICDSSFTLLLRDRSCSISRHDRAHGHCRACC
jgi:hypothetical protein